MAGKPKYTKEQVIKALEDVQGMMFLAAKNLGCNVETIRNYRKRYKEVASVFEQKHGEQLDVAESALYRGLLAGEAWAVCFKLKTQGKDRGYYEKTEQHNTGEVAVKVMRVISPPGAEPLDANGLRQRQLLNGSSNGHANGDS